MSCTSLAAPWRVRAFALLLAAVAVILDSWVARAQFYQPYLPPQPEFQSIHGRVAGLGPVLDDEGRQQFAEYTSLGAEKRTFPAETGMYIRSVSDWNAEVDEWLAARTQHELLFGVGTTQKLKVEDYNNTVDSRLCLDPQGEAVTAESIPSTSDTRWVLVSRVTQGLPDCDEYILARSTLGDEPDVRIEGATSLLVSAEDSVLQKSSEGSVFAIKSGYFSPREGFCAENQSIPSAAIRNLEAYRYCRPTNMERIWAPLGGVSVETTVGLSFLGAVTNDNGFYQIPYTTFGSEWDASTIYAEVDLVAFNPRFPSSRRFFLKRQAVGANTVRTANFAIDLVQVSATARMVDEAGDPIRLVGYGIEGNAIVITNDEFTEFEYAPPAAGETNVGVEGRSYETEPFVLSEHIGLVRQISAADLQLTDAYLYRVADGKLIGARRGMTPANLVGIPINPAQFPGVETPEKCLGHACLAASLTTRGPASRTFREDDYTLDGEACADPSSTKICGRPPVSLGGTDVPFRSSTGGFGFGSEVEYLTSSPSYDFLRPGDVVQLVMVNRATGYLGSTQGSLRSINGQLVLDAIDIEMKPPNLLVEAKRRFKVAGGQTAGAEREYIVGFEGAALNTDEIIEITTEWLDHDGKPLPEDLPGFTGRLASVVDDRLVEEPADLAGQFPIKPGRRTHIARIPQKRLEIGNFYIHVDAAPAEENVDFQGALFTARPSFAVNQVCYWSDGDQSCFEKTLSDSPSPLEERPGHLVPFKVPVFNEKRTRDLAEEQRRQLQEAWSEGETLPILEQVDPQHEWLYRPEFAFSVMDLTVEEPEIITDEAGTRITVDYALVGPDETEQLDPLGDQQFVFSLGYEELLATILGDAQDGPSQALFDNAGDLIAETTGGQLGAQADVLGAILGPEDFLVLQLYLQHDSYNGLYEFAFGAALNAFADVRTLHLERVHRRARFDHHAIPQPTAYTDSYEFLSFEIKNASTVGVVLIDELGAEQVLPLLVNPNPLLPGRYRFVVDYQTLIDAGFDPESSPRFVLEIRTTYQDGDGQDVQHNIAYAGTLEEREQGEIIGQDVVHDVVISDGSLRLEREDFRVRGMGPDLAFVRTYSSTNTAEGVLGRGWRHQLEYKVVAIESGDPNSTQVQEAAVPQWVRDLKGNIFGTSERPPASHQWIEVLVNGTRFRKYQGNWYPERGRHGSLVEENGNLVFVAMDGTRYRYRVPSLPGADDTGPGSSEDVPVTVGDAAAYRVGLAPLDLDCLLTESVIDMETPNGHRLEFVYGGDPQGDVRGICGDLLAIKEVDLAGQEGRRISFSYESVGLVDPTNQNPDGSVRRLKQVTGPGDIVVAFDYDNQGRLEKATRANRVEDYDYPDGTRQAYLASAQVDPGPQSDLRRYEYYYHQPSDLVLDGSQFGAILKPEQIVKQIVLPPVALDPQESPGPHTVDFIYDFGANNTREVVDARGAQTTYELDDVGRPLRILGPLGKHTEMTWDPESGYTASRLERTDFGDRTTTYTYTFEPPLLIRLQSIVEDWPLEGGVRSRTTVFDPRFNKPVSRTDRNGFTETWLYDDDGNLDSYTDAEEKTWSYTYYADTKLRQTEDPPGTRPATSFTYDENGYLETTRTPLGYITTTTHDARGRLRVREDALERETFFDYDDLDNLELITRPTITPAAARQEALSSRNHTAVQEFTFDALGRKTSETDHNGVKLTYDYDARGLVRKITRSAAASTFAVPEAERAFLYDANGNLKEETDWKGQPTRHVYNALNQRTGTTNRVGDQMSYSYDAVGNLKSTIDFNDVTTTYGYDVLGRRTSMDARGADDSAGAAMTWTYYDEDDPEANLKTMTVDRSPFSAVTTEYRINERYQRVKRINPPGFGEYTWSYRDDGLLEFEEDEEGLRTARVYDEDARIEREEVSDDGEPIVLVTQFDEYDSVGNVIKITDPRGVIERRNYDSWNRLVRSRVEHSGGEYVTHSLYDGEGNVISVRDPKGHDRSTLRDALGRVRKTIAGDGAEVALEYDPNGNVELEIQRVTNRAGLAGATDIRTQITYDAEDREESRTEAVGTADSRQRRVLEYDGAGNPLRVQGFNLAVTEYSYDPNNNRIREDLPGGNDFLAWSYSRSGLLESQDDARGNRTNFEYDELNRLTRTIDPGGIYEEVRGYDNVGNLTLVTDRRRIDTEYEYDGFHRRRRVLRDGQVIAVYGYDAVGNLRFEQDGNCDRIDYCYEERNLRTHTYFPVGDSNGGLVGCEAGGTALGLNACTFGAGAAFIQEEHDLAGNVALRTNEEGQDTVFAYDAENRLISETFATETTTYTYDEAGLLLARGRGTFGTVDVVDAFEYDMLGRLQKACEGGNCPVAVVATQYEYDDAGNRTLTTLPSGAATRYDYDARNRLERIVQDPGGLSLTTRYTLDGHGNIDLLTDANGQVIDYQYDVKNRRVQADYPAQIGDSFYEIRSINWYYDGNDNVERIEMAKLGPSGPITDVTVLTYNSRDSLLSSTQRGYTVHYDYDKANQRTGVGVGALVVEGADTSTVYKYDARGRVTNVVTPGGTAVYTYLDDGRLDFMTQPNGVLTDYEYSAQNRISAIEHRAGGSLLARYAYTYDVRGNRLTQSSDQVEQGSIVQRTRRMAYDAADRLCAVAEGEGVLPGTLLESCAGAGGDVGGVAETRYTFDGYNRATETQLQDGLQVSSRAYGYDAANRLETVGVSESGSPFGTVSYTYDDNGNTLSITDSRVPDETTGFVYNPRDQLVQVTRGPPGGGEAILGRYDYDGDGQRVRVEALGELSELVYDGLALLQSHKEGSEEAFVHRGPTGELLGVKAPGAPMQWMHGDVLGSPVVRTDEVGALVTSTRYDVFGEVASREETGTAEGPRFGFTGHQYDTGTELVYANARYYQPGLGRFLTQDAFLGHPQRPASVHRYLYAAHSPAVLIDPAGFDSTTTLIDERGVQAARDGDYLEAAGWALLKGAYYVGSLGFAVVHDPVRDAYDRGDVTTGQYLAAGVGGGLAVVGVTVATGGTGSGFVAAGTTLTAQAGRAVVVGAVEGFATDVLTQSALVSTGLQDEFSVTQTAVSTGFAGLLGGTVPAGGATLKGIRGSPLTRGVATETKSRVTQVSASARTKVADIASTVTREMPGAARSVGQTLSGGVQGIRGAARELVDLARRIEVVGPGNLGGAIRLRPRAPGGRHGDFHGPWRPEPGPDGPPGFNSWGEYLESLGAGPIPRGSMRSPHAHHSVQRVGKGAQQPLLERAHDILRRRGGIEAYFDPDNLAWNSLGGGNHGTPVVRDQLRRLEALDAANGTPEQFRELLQTFTREASQRTQALGPP